MKHCCVCNVVCNHIPELISYCDRHEKAAWATTATTPPNSFTMRTCSTCWWFVPISGEGECLQCAARRQLERCPVCFGAGIIVNGHNGSKTWCANCFGRGEVPRQTREAIVLKETPSEAVMEGELFRQSAEVAKLANWIMNNRPDAIRGDVENAGAIATARRLLEELHEERDRLADNNYDLKHALATSELNLYSVRRELEQATASLVELKKVDQ